MEEEPKTPMQKKHDREQQEQEQHQERRHPESESSYKGDDRRKQNPG